MAALKTATSSSSTPQFHATDAHGNHIALQALGQTGNITIGSPSNFIVLSKQAVLDLVPALTTFSVSGTLS